MFTSAEKTSKPAGAVKATADKTSFFRKAGEESFFSSKTNPSFFNSTVQAKLNISQPNDPLEKEADETADKVMRMPDAAVPSIAEKKEDELQRKEDEQEEMIQPKMIVNAGGSLVMRSEEPGEVNEETVQPKLYSAGLMRKEAEEEQEETVQRKEEEQEETIQRFADSNCCSAAVIHRKERGPPTTHTSTFSSQLQQSKGQGAPLNHSVLHNMQNRFGADFSSVRIHNNNTSAQLSSNINAQAFTHGNDIYFNHGKYNPHTSSGGSLLAHELTHTIQQGAATLHRKAKSPATSPFVQTKTEPQQLTAEPRPELIRAVHHAKSQIGKVNASQTTPDGLRVGADRLVEYFKTAMGDEAILEGNQPYKTGSVHIDNIRYKKEAKGMNPLDPTGPAVMRDAMPSWCGIFTFWALNKGGIPMKKWKLGQAAVDIKSAYPPGYTPRAGDIAYKGPPYHHYAIVENATGGAKNATVNTVDGNTAGEDNLGAQVQQRSQSMSVWKLFFNPLYGLEEQLPQNPEALTPEEINKIMSDAGASSTSYLSAPASTAAEIKPYTPAETTVAEMPAPVTDEASAVVPAEETKEGTVEVKAEVIPTSPKTPEEDPAYQQIMQQAGSVKSKQKTHDTPKSKADAAQLASAIPVDLDKSSQAQFHKVNEMELQDKQKFNADAFKKQLNDRIEGALPKDDNETVDRYEHPSKAEKAMSEAKDGMKTDVKEEKKKAGNAIETTTSAPPSEEGVKPKETADMQPEDAGKKPHIPKAEAAAPKPKTDEEISMEKDAQSLDDQMAESDVTEEQLANSNEPTFGEALSSKQEAQTQARNAPAEYRAKEQPQIAKAEDQAKATVAGKLTEMHEGRAGALAKVDEGKNNTKTKDEEKRKEIAGNLQRIYNETKEKVTTLLTNLETNVITEFDTAANAANTVFERNVHRRLDDHYGITTVDDTVGDYMRGGLSPEIGKIFREEKATFMNAMNTSINSIASKVETELNAAITAIDEGKKAIDEYWNSLTPEMQKIGEEAKTDIGGKFDELEQSVHAKHDELVEKLGDRYVKNVEKLQETFDKIKSEKQGWLSKAVDAIAGVIKAILRLKDMLLETLAKVAHVIGKIIKDPIGFLSNLIAAVKMGLDNFVKNIMDHMKKGLIAWLLGNMPPGLQLPDKWDLPGIFHFVMQIIGLTWTNIRQRAVLKMGEPVVAALEEVFDIFQIIIKEGLPGLWRYIKEKVGNLQVMVMDAIQDFLVEKIIKAGITWVIGLMNPAGAFIKACKLIYDIVMFFVERGKQIMDLVNAVIDSVALIVEGSLGQAAKMVEDALAKMIPVTLGFLAALLGLNGITEKVQKIIKAVQTPINKAIDWVLDKAIAFSKKLGLDKLVKKVKGGINNAKDWAKEKVKQGKEKVKQVGAKIMGWVGLKKKVSVRKGETHTLYFNKGSRKMMMASTPVVFGDFINSIVIPVKKQSKLNPIKAGLVSMLQQVDGLIANTTMSEDDKQQKIQAILEIIGPEIAELIRETSGALLTSEAPRYGGVHGGFGSSMRVRIVDGNPATTGGQPSVGGGNWDALRKRKTSMGSKDTFYIRAHLLNDNLGGPGDTWSNLSILSQQANNRDWYGSGSHETAVETRLKGPLSENGKGFIYVVTANYSRSQNAALINIVDSLIAFKNAPLGAAPVVPSDYTYLNAYSVGQLTDVKQILEAEKFVPTTFVCTIKEIDPSVGEEVVTSDHNINRTITNDIQGQYYL
ncbi:DUF4157 domain-containing protein [Lacibacter sp. H375]|uniref:eCIS core domain-containing protein n=1 Tax=Lacibacter sp. H375 TaxID=3133424 RepID=UPI0030C047A6